MSLSPLLSASVGMVRISACGAPPRRAFGPATGPADMHAAMATVRVTLQRGTALLIAKISSPRRRRPPEVGARLAPRIGGYRPASDPAHCRRAPAHDEQDQPSAAAVAREIHRLS